MFDIRKVVVWLDAKVGLYLNKNWQFGEDGTSSEVCCLDRGSREGRDGLALKRQLYGQSVFVKSVNRIVRNASPMKGNGKYDISVSPWPCYSSRPQRESFTLGKLPRRRKRWREKEKREGSALAKCVFDTYILRLFLLFWDHHGYPWADVDRVGTIGSPRSGHDELAVFYSVLLCSSRCEHGRYRAGQVNIYASLTQETPQNDT